VHRTPRGGKVILVARRDGAAARDPSWARAGCFRVDPFAGTTSRRGAATYVLIKAAAIG
jgi:hypothetical protein